MIHKREWLFLIVSSLICFGLTLFRMFITQTHTYFFLNWNLFLAILPFVFTTFSLIVFGERMPKLLLLLMVSVWLLFFPNAPYILTDLIHLSRSQGTHLWYDLIMILIFAWTGLMAGFFSLKDIEKQVDLITKNKYKTYFIIGSILFLSAFGVYLGRYLRFNSWDLVCNPFELISEIIHRFRYPTEHPRTWGVTILFGFLLNIIYLSFKLLKFGPSTQKY